MGRFRHGDSAPWRPATLGPGDRLPRTLPPGDPATLAGDPRTLGDPAPLRSHPCTLATLATGDPATWHNATLPHGDI